MHNFLLKDKSALNASHLKFLWQIITFTHIQLYVFNFWNKILKLAYVLVLRLNRIYLYVFRTIITISYDFELCLRNPRDHPFKTSANFSRFLTPTSLPSAVFYYYPSANLAKVSFKGKGWVKGVEYCIRTEFSEKGSMKKNALKNTKIVKRAGLFNKDLRVPRRSEISEKNWNT